MKSNCLLYISLSALIVRVLYFFQELVSPFFMRPLLDQHYYDLCARQLAGHGGDLIDGFRPLLYPLFISIFYRIAPESGMLLSIFAQMALGIGMTVMIASIAILIFNNRISGIVAAALFILSAPPLYFESQLLITTLFSFLLLLLSVVVFQALESASTKKSVILWASSGIVLGLAAQARPNALPLLLFFPLIGIFRWVQSLQKASRLPALLPLLAIPGLLMVQVLFGAINAQYSGNFSLMTQAGGINFYLGNSKTADGMIPRQDRHVVYSGEYRDPIQIMAEQGYRESTGKKGAVPQQEISNHWKQKTIGEIQADPARWLHLMVKKTWLMCWNHEVPNNRSFSFSATQDTPILRFLPVRWWLLLFLFPWGIAALNQRNAREQILWIFSFLILFSGTIVLFFVNSRFRIPLWPLMTVVAGGGALYLWSSIKTRMIPKIPLLFSIILLPISLINWFGIPPDPIENDLSMRASAYYDHGRYEEAMADILQCLEIAPQNPRYHFTMGNILLASEDYSAAIQTYQKSLILNNKDPMFHNNLGIAYECLNSFEMADQSYKEALKLQPSHLAARTNRMLLLIRLGELDTAKSQLQSLLRNDPENSMLLCAQAILIFKDTGNKKALEYAEQLNPTLTEQLK